MSTEISTKVEPTAEEILAASKIGAINPNSEINEALTANARAGGVALQESSLTRVKTPSSGMTKWNVETLEGEQLQDTIEGVCVLISDAGLLWPNPKATGQDTPLLRTEDLVHAYRVGTEYGDIDADELEKHKTTDAKGRECYKWQDLPYSQFGSYRNGKRVEEFIRVMLLPFDGHKPFVVNIKAGSFKVFNRFRDSMNLPHWRYVVELSLTKAKNAGGDDYSQVVPRVKETLSKVEGDAIKQAFTGPLHIMLDRGIDDAIAFVKQEENKADSGDTVDGEAPF